MPSDSIVARLTGEGDAGHLGKDLCVKAEEGTGELPASPSYTYAWVSSSKLENLISDHVLSVY